MGGGEMSQSIILVIPCHHLFESFVLLHIQSQDVVICNHLLIVLVRFLPPLLSCPSSFAGGESHIFSCSYISISRQLFSQDDVLIVRDISIFNTPPLFAPLGYCHSLYSIALDIVFIHPTTTPSA